MSDPGSVLVCRLSALGDVVLALPVVDALRVRFPRAHLAFLSREPFGRLLAGVEALDELLLWPGRGRELPVGAKERTWDLAVDLSGTGRSRRLFSRLRAARILRAEKQTLRRFALVRLRGLGGGGVRVDPAVDRMFAALRPLDLVRDGRRPRLTEGAPPPDGPLLVAPGGGRDTKRWPAERFREVVARVTASGRSVLLLGSSGEANLLAKIAEGAPASRVETVAHADPSELPAIAARCPVALTNDSGILHVAEACGARVVAIFGPTHPRLGFAPLDPSSRALHGGIACSPCDPHGPPRCPKGHHRCMTDVTVDEVLRALAVGEGQHVG